MNPINSLGAVLLVRRRREETAERALAATVQEIARWKAKINLLHEEIVKITASRVQDIERVTTADHHQSREAWYRSLLQQRAEADRKLQTLEGIQAERVNTYWAARCAREVVGELEGRRRAVYQAEAQLREQRWNEGNFLARKVSNEHNWVLSYDASDPKESA